jgi:hypothetical protein
MKVITIVLLFYSVIAFSQEKESRFPIRLKSLYINYAQYQHGIDIINMFSDHLKIEPEGINNYAWGVDIRIMSFLDLIFYRDTYTLKFPKSSKYTFDQYEYDYEKYQYGFRLHFFNIALEFGTGERQFHTFLETDTSYYFHREIVSPYTFINLNYTYPTSLYFDMNLFYEQVFFNNSTTKDIIVDEGDQKNFGIKFIFGSKYQVAPFFVHSYTNIKLIHKFFGLKNEMNNKFFEEKLGLSLIYNY